jgi:hypothetical protein
MIGNLDPKAPGGPLDRKWTSHKDHARLVSPNNRRKFEIIVVGSGLAGGSAAATLGELGYRVKCFCYQDSARRAHSIAAQGGINAAKNYQNDGDSVYRLFYDTIKGGDFRSREANVYRLAEVSGNIIDQCVAQGVPFAREYGGLLANRSFGGAQVSRTFYARGQTGQQLLLGCYSALCRQIDAGTVQMFPQTEMLDVVIVDGHAKGIVTRNLRTGRVENVSGDAVVLATGGYGNVFYLSTNARGCNVTATYRAYKKSRNERKIVPSLQTRFPKRTAIIISNESTRLSEISLPATSLPARPRKSAMKAVALALAVAVFISISRTRSSVSANKQLPSATETCLKFTKKSPARTPTKFRCEFIPPFITQWAACGLITI